MAFTKLNPVPSWFAHDRCSTCEHFLKLTMKCEVQTPADPCNHTTGHNKYKKTKKVNIKKPIESSKKTMATPTCNHPNLQPHIQKYGKRIWQGEGETRVPAIIWEGSYGASYLKTILYWCPDCNAFIKPPRYIDEGKL